jgi:hypothetical protein
MNMIDEWSRMVDVLLCVTVATVLFEFAGAAA